MIKGESLSINAKNQSISLSSTELRVICATARQRRDLTFQLCFLLLFCQNQSWKAKTVLKWVITKGSNTYFVDLIKNKVWPTTLSMSLVQGCNSVHFNMTWQWIYCQVFCTLNTPLFWHLPVNKANIYINILHISTAVFFQLLQGLFEDL